MSPDPGHAESAGWRRRTISCLESSVNFSSAACLRRLFFFSNLFCRAPWSLATVVPEYLLRITEMAGISSEGELICSKQPSIFLPTTTCQAPLKAICCWPASSGSCSRTERAGVACCFRKKKKKRRRRGRGGGEGVLAL